MAAPLAARRSKKGTQPGRGRGHPGCEEGRGIARAAAKAKAFARTRNGGPDLQLNRELNRKLLDAPDAASLIGLCEKHSGAFDAFNNFSALRLLAYKRDARSFAGNHVVAKLRAALRPQLRQLKPKSLAFTAWSLAKLAVEDSPMLAGISAEALRNMGAFECYHMASMAWACAKLVFRDRPLIQAISKEVIPSMHEFNAQSMVNLVWSCAHLAFKDAPLMTALSSAAMAQIGEFVPQDLANTAWAFSTLDCPDAPLMQAIA